jgi:hypothetical protein
MCQCGSQSNTTPGTGSGNQPVSPVQVCPGFQSSIVIIDELGRPVQNTSVRVAVSGGPPQTMTTDSSGRICFHQPPGTAVQVEVLDTHEAAAGHSTTTASGRHFGHLAPGP